MRLKVKFGDILIIATLIILAVIMAVSQYEKNTEYKIAVISQNNVVLDRIYLKQQSDPYTFSYSGKYPGIIEAQNGKIRFLQAQCPDQVCVHTGWIQRPGQIAVCLPAEVMIKIEGVDNSDVDIIVK